jgi:aconitate hydratase
VLLRSPVPLEATPRGRPVFLADLWPGAQEVEQLVERSIPEVFRRVYAGIFDGTTAGRPSDAPTGSTLAWGPASA